ncbi:MAG: alkaline phosphatase family protein, partial [Bacteroidetes bacterium]|nr:alkaline phosphatase family protein [Bacteroidota bacterium]
MKYKVSIIACILTVGLFAQEPLKKAIGATVSVKPKLVVGIVIDQMRYDYIYRYWNKFGNEGFKRLVNEGFFCRNTNYNYVPTYTGPGHASIYTGTTPAIHGIIANDWYDKATGKNLYCAGDKKSIGVGTTANEGKRSHVNMLTTTITDELRISSNMKSKVIGIALKDRSSILPAGHIANAAYWYDGSIGSFISSTYYMKELPVWVNEFNKKELAQKYLSQPWNTILPIETYTESLPDDNKYEFIAKGETKPVFPHNLPELMKANGGLNMIRSTPFGNSLTKDFAIEVMKNENLGKSGATDFLAVSFSSPDYIGHAYGPNSVEQEDNYIRLDKDLAELLKFIDGYIGKNNTLVFLTADHAAPEVPSYLIDLKIPAGYVDESKIERELKGYLLKSYGDTLVLSFSNQQVFLNHVAIADKKLELKKVQDDVATFMQNAEGIAEVLTATTLNNTSFTEGSRYLMQKGFNANRSGDVLVNYLPAWVDGYSNTGTTHGSPYSYDTHVPLIFYGWNIQYGSSAEHVYITDVAATLAMMLNIQFPNGCTGKPIPFLVK